MRNEVIKKTVLAARPFRYLDIHELDELISYSQVRHYEKDQNILSQGKRGEGMVIIMHGSAFITASVLGKEMLTLITIMPGDFVGEVSLIQKSPCAISVVAKEALECLIVSSAYFDMLSVFFPQIKYKISQAITEDVCERLKMQYHGIVRLISEMTMTTQSIFTEVERAIAKPERVKYQNMNLNLEQLKLSAFFKDFTQIEFEQLIEISDLYKAPKNCELIKHNESDLGCYIILRGAVQVSINHEHKKVKYSVLGPLEIFSSMVLINQSPSLLTYTTCERAVFLKFSAEKLALLKVEHPELWYKIYDSICRSFVCLEQAGDKLYIRLNSEIYNRILHV